MSHVMVLLVLYFMFKGTLELLGFQAFQEVKKDITINPKHFKCYTQSQVCFLPVKVKVCSGCKQVNCPSQGPNCHIYSQAQSRSPQALLVPQVLLVLLERQAPSLLPGKCSSTCQTI